MGVNQLKVPDKVENAGYDFIENKIRHIWFGLIEAWIPFREARKSVKEQDELKKNGLKVSEYKHATTDEVSHDML